MFVSMRKITAFAVGVSLMSVTTGAIAAAPAPTPVPAPVASTASAVLFVYGLGGQQREPGNVRFKGIPLVVD